MIKKMAISFLLACALYVSTADYEYVVETYIVQASDTLDSITDLYMQKNTYGKREHNEFKSGIIELNESLWTREKDDFKLCAGEQLKIAYWIKK